MARKLSVYYHIWSPDGTDLWRFLVDEQLKRICRSQLPENATVHGVITGPQAPAIARFVSAHRWLQIVDVTTDASEYEGATLKHVHQAAQDDPALHAVLYLHTKGISHLSGTSPLCRVPGIDVDRMFRAVNSWRHVMEWGVIDRWREAVDKLDTVQVAGVNHCLDPWPHMSGNFWWARADYLRSLIHPTRDPFPGDAGDFGNVKRMNFEKWIGLNQPACFSFYDFPNSRDSRGIGPDVAPKPGEPQDFWVYRDDIGPHFQRERW